VLKCCSLYTGAAGPTVPAGARDNERPRRSKASFQAGQPAHHASRGSDSPAALTQNSEILQKPVPCGETETLASTLTRGADEILALVPCLCTKNWCD